MPGLWVIAGHILIPLAFGLVPGLLPRRVTLSARWMLWLALLAVSAAYVVAMRPAQPPFPWLVLVPFWLSSLLSLYVLVAQTRRAGPAPRTPAKT